MKTILISVGVVAFALNAMLYYVKFRTKKTNEDESSKRKDELGNSNISVRKIKGRPDIRQLKESAAAELGIAVEQLDLMAVDEIEQLAIDKGLI